MELIKLGECSGVNSVWRWDLLYQHCPAHPRWAMANSYGFSIPMCLLYFWPLVSPFSSDSFPVRLHEATLNWVIWLTCFTEIAFQIPHNLAVSTLKSNAGKLIEWYEPLSFFK